MVVGAGPVGMFTALSLAQHGISVTILDAQWRTGAHSYALALHPSSLALFERVGLLDDVLSQSYRVRGVRLWEGIKPRHEMSISRLADDFSFLAVMRQDVLENMLELALKKKGVKVQWSHRLGRLSPAPFENAVSVQVLGKESFGYAVAHSEWLVEKTKQAQVPFIIGADGIHSTVRQELGFSFDALGAPEYYAVFEFKTDMAAEHLMHLVIDEKTSNVCWPMPNGYCRWSFLLNGFVDNIPSRRKDHFDLSFGDEFFPELEEEQLHQLIEERAPWFTGSVEEITWRKLVRFDHRMASDFGAGTVALVGDAGHTTSPAGLQSMNIGLREGWDVAQIIAERSDDDAFGSSMDAYRQARMREWRFLLGIDGGLDVKDAKDSWLAPYSTRILSSLPASGRNLYDMADQLGLEASLKAAIA